MTIGEFRLIFNEFNRLKSDFIEVFECEKKTAELKYLLFKFEVCKYDPEMIKSVTEKLPIKKQEYLLNKVRASIFEHEETYCDLVEFNRIKEKIQQLNLRFELVRGDYNDFEYKCIKSMLDNYEINFDYFVKEAQRLSDEYNRDFIFRGIKLLEKEVEI